MDSNAAVQMCSPADRLCSGCDQPAYDVGPLTRCRVTFVGGSSAPVDYCTECEELIEVAILEANSSSGATALPTHIVRLERDATFPRPMSVHEFPPPRFPKAAAEREPIGVYRNAVQPLVRAWLANVFADTVGAPLDEREALIIAEHLATREVGRPLYAIENQLLGEAVRDILCARWLIRDMQQRPRGPVSA